jgi:hypothetical protein
MIYRFYYFSLLKAAKANTLLMKFPQFYSNKLHIMKNQLAIVFVVLKAFSEFQDKLLRARTPYQSSRSAKFINRIFIACKSLHSLSREMNLKAIYFLHFVSVRKNLDNFLAAKEKTKCRKNQRDP